MHKTSEAAKPQIFQHPMFGEIRAVEIDGKPYFVGVDVARALEYANPSKAVLDHCKGVSKLGIPSAGGVQETNVIPEGDVWRLIVKAADQSRNHEIKAKAEKFERWIFDEVLPSIRKHGAYMTEQTIERALTDPDFLIRLATQLKEEREARKALEAQIEQDKPFTNFAKSIAHSSDAITFGEFAKLLNNNGIRIGRNRLFDWMRRHGYLIKSGREKNKPKQQYVEQGLFQVKENVVHAVDQDFIRTTTLITGKGQLYFLELLRKSFGGGEADEGASR